MQEKGLKKFVVHGGVKYEWLGQSTMRMTTTAGTVIYTDPVMLDDNAPPADLILISHHHVDHCLPDFISAIRTPSTMLGAFHTSYTRYCTKDIKGVRTIKIGGTVEFGPVRVTAVDAYARRGFHLKGEGCGFVIETEGVKIYFSGDTAKTPEMEELRDATLDTAIVSICDNTYYINPEDIAAAVKEIAPRLFIPVHYTPPDEPDPEITDGVFSTSDPRFFTRKEDPESLLPLLEGTGIEVAILKKLVSFT